MFCRSGFFASDEANEDVGMPKYASVGFPKLLLRLARKLSSSSLPATVWKVSELLWCGVRLFKKGKREKEAEKKSEKGRRGGDRQVNI